MTLIQKTLFACLAALIAACSFTFGATAAPFQKSESFRTQNASDALVVKVAKKHKRGYRNRHYRNRRYHRRNRIVDAPYTYVDGYRGNVEVDAPYAYVNRSRRGVRVRAPFVDIYIPR